MSKDQKEVEKDINNCQRVVNFLNQKVNQRCLDVAGRFKPGRLGLFNKNYTKCIDASEAVVKQIDKCIRLVPSKG